MGTRLVLVAATWAAVVGMVVGSANAQSPTPTGERFVLSGVVFVEGGRGLAWLQEPTFTNNQVITVRPGDSVGPYRVTKILEDQVQLEGPGGTVSVPLAGSPGTVGAAASRGTGQARAREPAPRPALNNPEATVIPRGDPRRNFPTSVMLPGAAAQQAGGAARQAQPQASGPPAVSPGRDLPAPAAKQTPPPELPPHPALNNPGSIVIPRGDSRRNFPVGVMLPH